MKPTAAAGPSTPATAPAPAPTPGPAPASAPAPTPLLTDAASVARQEAWAASEDPLPLYTIISNSDLPPAEDVREAYHAAILSRGVLPSSPDFTTALDDIEVGWGGLPGDQDACISFRARYALSAGFPITPSLVADLVAGTTTGAQRARLLRDADVHLGGSGDGSSLTPLAYFRKNAPWNLLFIEEAPPALSDVPRLLHLAATTRDPSEIAPLVEQWDYAFDGNGDGAALIAALPPAAWRNFPGTLDHVLAVPCPDPTIADVVGRLGDAIAHLSGPHTQPSLLSLSRLLWRYDDWSDTPPSAFSQVTLELMAVEHTPYRPLVDCLPWHHSLSPLVLRRLQASDVNDSMRA